MGPGGLQAFSLLDLALDAVGKPTLRRLFVSQREMEREME